MRGKHASSAARQKARAESEVIHGLQEQVAELTERLKTAASPTRSPEESRLSAALAAAVVERDEAVAKAKRSETELGRMQEKVDILAKCVAEAAREERIEPTIPVWLALIAEGYEQDAPSRQMRRLALGSNMAAVYRGLERESGGPQ